MRRKLLLAPVLAALFALPALTQTAAPAPNLPPLKLQDLHLDNGLRVILAPDHASPVFGICITYNVGSRNERPGRTGFAHLFEHMMFEGSENVGKGEHFILVENNGGGMNGTTTEDRTNYFEVLPKNQLDLALFLEADRMGHLAVNEPNLDNQRNAVQEERRLGVDNQPYGKSYEEVESMAYDAFPYHHSVIGSMEDLNAASVQDVKDFFRTYYAPNNAVLVLVGDVNPAEALAKVKKYFSDIPKQTPPPELSFSEPDHDKERRKTMTDPLARLPQILMAYNAPPGDTPDHYALQVLDDVLSGGRSSRFYQHLVREKQLAVNANVFTQGRRGPSLFEIVALARPGVKVEDLEKAIDDEIAAVQKDGITEAELAKARTQILRQQIQTRSSSLFTAVTIGTYAVNFNDPNLINTAYDKLAAVTVEQVKQAAQKYLVPAHRAVVITTPAPRPTTAAGVQ